MKPPAQVRPLDKTTITGSWKIQLVKDAREVLERKGRKLKPGDSLMWCELENGELAVRIR